MNCHLKEIAGANGARELFVTVTPDESGSDPEAMLRTAAGVLHESGARPIRERLFAPAGKLDAMRTAAHEALIGAGPRARAEFHAGANGPCGGVQLHGLISGSEIAPLLLADGACGGVSFTDGGTRYALTSGLSADEGDGPAQSRRCFDRTELLLAGAGLSLHDVARTWFYMHDILGWYGPFNTVRNTLFIERGLMRKGQPPGDVTVPASTGMGVRPASGARVSLEAFAAAGTDAALRRHAAAGAQRSAFEYGSAFARSAECRTPGGRTLFVSGTAAIDTQGRTCHLGDAASQTRMTLQNVLAVLTTAGMRPNDVVEAVAYCKTPGIAAHFCRTWRREIAWPWLVVVGDVCRDDLLFEAEVTAVAGAGS
jgi:enamine deaminase RidA (YjgF/YER057c/UK114 family)